jgi:flagellar operon protein (TIGR03826 family)
VQKKRGHGKMIIVVFNNKEIIEGENGMDFRNCPRCDNLFRYLGRNLCSSCMKTEEEEFDRVRIYVRDHEGTSILEVSEATEISVTKIIRFLREGRLLSKGMDMSGGILTCESCGGSIEEGRLCKLCRAKFANEFERTAGKKPAETKPINPVTTGRDKMYTINNKKK